MFRRYAISEIGDIISGATPKTTVPDNFGGEIPWLTPADLSGYTGKYISHGARNLTRQGYDSCSTHLMPVGTVLLSSRAPIGYVAIAKNEICTNQGFKSIVPKTFVNSEFLYYQLKSLKNTLQNLGSGTTFKELSAKKLATVQVVIPSLEEQKSIVSKIEELFSRLDASVAELQTAKEKLKVYRQAVLFRAFQNLTDTIAMDKVADMIDPQPSHRTPPEVMDGVPYIGVGDIDYSVHKVNFSEARKVSPSVLEEHRERYTLHKGDFIIGKIGTIGKPFVVPLPQDYTLSANVILIQPNCEKIVPEFLYWQFSSPLVTQQLTTGAVATNQQAFGIKKARLLSIKMCCVELQRQIVSEIEGALSICDSIQQTIDTSLRLANALRQSILKQAFEGALAT